LDDKIEFVHCRTLRHPWRVVDVTDDVDDDFSKVLGKSRLLRLRCRSCATIRIDRVGADGDLIERNYEYPRGYRLTKNDVRPELEQLRLTLLDRHQKAGEETP